MYEPHEGIKHYNFIARSLFFSVDVSLRQSVSPECMDTEYVVNHSVPSPRPFISIASSPMIRVILIILHVYVNVNVHVHSTHTCTIHVSV